MWDKALLTLQLSKAHKHQSHCWQHQHATHWMTARATMIVHHESFQSYRCRCREISGVEGGTQPSGNDPEFAVGVGEISP